MSGAPVWAIMGRGMNPMEIWKNMEKYGKIPEIAG
jgi:hypothetical protein